MKKLMALLAAVGMTVGVAGAADAKPVSEDQAIWEVIGLQTNHHKDSPALGCHAVPIRGGDTASLSGRWAKSGRNVEVTWRYGGYPFGTIEIGTSKVMVLKAEMNITDWSTGETVTRTAERQGPPSKNRDSCYFSGNGHVGSAYGFAEVKHLTPLELPSAAEIMAQCDGLYETYTCESFIEQYLS